MERYPPLFPGESSHVSMHQLDCVRTSYFPAAFGLTDSFPAAILSMIVQAIYAVCPVSGRHSESKFLEGLLDKWYIDLPDHLRYDPGSLKRPVPPPHVLTLHMQYWCAVLLLHRPL
jgi:hypothetical protein